MIYFKSVVVGIVAALAVSAVWILVVFLLPLAVPVLVSRRPGTEGGAEVAVAYLDSASILAVALIGFIVGFYSAFQRARRTRQNR